MGLSNCRFECHYYLDDKSSFFENLIKKEEEKNSPFIKLNQNITKELSDYSTDFDMSKYSYLISKKIISYIQNNKLNYKSKTFSLSYISDQNPNQFPNGNIYIGKINSNQKMEGYGIYILKDKNIVIEGIFNKGYIIFGRIFFPEDDIYEGEFSEFEPHGKGVFFLSNGDIYKGDFILGEMTGKGTYIFNDKTYYCGDFIKGLFNGEGTMKWSNGVEYHGIFSNSCFYNKGKIFNDFINEKYIGNFDKNEFNGKGIYKYQNGDKYEGDFVNGIRKGKGHYKAQNGAEYIGTWDKDLPNGEGMVFCNKFKIKGIWADGIKVKILQILEGDKNIEKIEKYVLNIRVSRRKIIPSFLPHLYSNNNTEISQYEMMTEQNHN